MLIYLQPAHFICSLNRDHPGIKQLIPAVQTVTRVQSTSISSRAALCNAVTAMETAKEIFKEILHAQPAEYVERIRD